MKSLRAWLFRFAGLFTHAGREQDLANEIEAHLQMHMDDNVRAGMTEEQARREALIKLGGMESAKQAYRDGSTIPILESVLQDARFAIRQLWKSPGFTVTATLLLAVGLCASAALFAFADAALIRPLPYPNPARLVHVSEWSESFPRADLSYLDYLDWKRLNTSFSSLDVYSPTGYLLNTGAGSEPVAAVRISDGFFRTLGISPMLGRDFYEGEDLAGVAKTVILSYGIWQRQYGGAKNIVGRTIPLSGVPHQIVGVLPPSFQFSPTGNAEVWTPFHATGGCDLRRSCHNLQGIARLKEGVSVGVALANMKAIAIRLEQEYGDSNRGQGASVLPLSEVVSADIRPVLLLLLGGGVLLLLIACVNVASLLLARSENRRREFAVRSSLGASSSRLMTQFVTEAFVLAAAGALVGLVFADRLMTLFIKLIPLDMMAGMPYLQGLGLNTHVLAFAGSTLLLMAVLFSVIPGLQLRYSDMRVGLTEGSRGSAGKAWRRLGSNLVVFELAIAMVLLVSAGLLSKSLNHLLHVDLNFQPDHLASLTVAAPESKYSRDEPAAELARQAVERLMVLPGVKSVGLTSVLPVSFNGNTDWIRFVGRPYSGEHNEVNEREVSPGYFRTLEAKLVRGRHFTPSDNAQKSRVAIINQTLAQKYFPGENPIGKRYGDDKLSPKSIREIIGVVENIREGSLDSEIWAAEYLPMSQSPDSSFSVVVRASQAEHSVLSAMRAEIHQIDPEIGVSGETTMMEHIGNSPSAYLHRSSAWLVSGFAGIALLLGVVGLYGVVAYSVSQRTREIGIRMALGAEPGNVYRLILGEASRLTAAGLAGGLICSLAATALIRKVLFQVSSWDVPTMLSVVLVLATAALLASYIPARRAALVNPTDALRTE